ncbi:HlyD family secretion protein [Aestuariivirga sp.]|jgi:multidrug resistance efflux pump|uniref:HlyD family secretion protein n=1 Tax=Aestuariivirga sp. TaxID=2650926 RepID=UPI003784D0D6
MNNMPTTIDPVKSRRATAGGVVRTAYATLLLGLAAILGWLMLKPLIYTESAGQVLAPRYIISTPYIAQIVEVNVRPGERVKAGDVVARVRSPEVEVLRAHLATSLAEQNKTVADSRIRRAVAEATLPAARKRAESAVTNAKKLGDKGCISGSLFCAEIIREEALSALMVAQTYAELKEISAEIAGLEVSLERIQEIYSAVLTSFNNGDQVTPISGVVSTRIAYAGQSVPTGQPIIEVLDESKQYVQWVMDSSRIRQPLAGDPVYILDGYRIIRGTISDLLSVSDVAAESVSIFRPADTGQVVIIKLNPGETYPPVMTHVEIRYNYWRSMDGLVEFYTSLMERLGLWSR